MKHFASKKQVFEYIKKKFLKKDVKGILIEGSSVYKELNDFSDVDFVVFNKTKIKPYAEIILVNKKIVLITGYFYLAKKPKKSDKELILYGEIFEEIEHKGNLKYTKKERIKRDKQMFVDMLFKYIRSKKLNYLDSANKYFEK